jgi:hypothetical protein
MRIPAIGAIIKYGLLADIQYGIGTPKGRWSFNRMCKIDSDIFADYTSDERILEVFSRVADEVDAEFASHDRWLEMQ